MRSLLNSLKRDYGAFGLLVLAMALVGSNVPIGKLIVADVSVLVFLSLRFVIATVALVIIARPTVWDEIRNIDRRDAGGIVAIALFGSILFTLLILEGTARTTAASAGLITATLPAVVSALAVVFLKQPLTRAAVVCIGLAVTGLVIMQFSAGGALPGAVASAPLIGNVLVLAAVVCEAIYVIVSGRAARGLSPIALSLVVSVVALIGSLPITVYALTFTRVPDVDLWLWIAIVWYALAASVFSTISWYAGARHATAWQA
ncbi:MAG: DMT family transporter, partial [Pseudomonadota bacterium]